MDRRRGHHAAVVLNRVRDGERGGSDVVEGAEIQCLFLRCEAKFVSEHIHYKYIEIVKISREDGVL